MRKIILFLFLIFASITSKAQINEIGIFLGGANYIGDIGKENFIYPNNFAIGAFYKYNLNPRIAFKGTFTHANITANDSDSKNTARKIRGIQFDNTIKEFALGLEFNFFNYNQLSNYNYYTPYIIVEAAVFNYNVVSRELAPHQYAYTKKTGYALPFGLGYKTRLIENFALSFEVKARYTFTDDIDYNNPEITTLNFGNPNSNDWYVFTGISLIYAFGREACYAPAQ